MHEGRVLDRTMLVNSLGLLQIQWMAIHLNIELGTAFLTNELNRNFNPKSIRPLQWHLIRDPSRETWFVALVRNVGTSSWAYSPTSG